MYPVPSKKPQVFITFPLTRATNVNFQHDNVLNGALILSVYMDITITSDEIVDEIGKRLEKRSALHFCICNRYLPDVNSYCLIIIFIISINK